MLPCRSQYSTARTNNHSHECSEHFSPMACKHCQPKTSILFYHQPLHLSLQQNHNHFPWWFTTEPQELPRDGRGSEDKIAMDLGNHGLYLTLFWYVHFAPIGHFHSKYLMSNKVTFRLLLLEKLHMQCLSVGIGRLLPGCGVKPHLQICIKIHQSQEAFFFYTPLICVITLTKLTQHPKVVCKRCFWHEVNT